MGEEENKQTDDSTGANKPKEMTPANAPEKTAPSDKKTSTDDLRKVIKINSTDKIDDKKGKPGEPATEDLDGTSREGLEQKRAILQSIKDFDFQIKKHQEDITALNTKLDSVSKDLDDLVSLYEIVSEQMNPFVGLSKVTKKRIDALENFTKEVDDLKTRIGDLESFAERTGVNIQEVREKKQHGLEDSSQTIKIDDPALKQNLSNEDLDKIIERAFTAMSTDNRIDMAIDEFIESLKG